MSEIDFIENFRKLGFNPEPLPDFYTPDLFAKNLLERYDKRQPVRICFSSSVEYSKKR